MHKCFVAGVMALSLIGSSSSLRGEEIADRFTLEEAFNQGFVDVSSDYWSRKSVQPLLQALADINPGVINRAGFLFGGPSSGWLDETEKLVKEIRTVAPRSLLVATLPELIQSNYEVTLPCAAGDQTFKADEMVTNPTSPENVHWIDMANDRAREYYVCLSHTFVDRGFDVIHFEASELVIANSSNATAALKGYKDVISQVRTYYSHNKKNILFSGDMGLANDAMLAFIYVPARVFHNASFAFEYRNKIERKGVGVGYSYALSDRIIDATKRAVSKNTRIVFYIDNWDASQDDLRRFMELDADNRRYMLQASFGRARSRGVYFAIPIEHCFGCVPADVVADSCEISERRFTKYTAYGCGDVDFIKKLLQAGRSATGRGPKSN